MAACARVLSGYLGAYFLGYCQFAHTTVYLLPYYRRKTLFSTLLDHLGRWHSLVPQQVHFYGWLDLAASLPFCQVEALELGRRK